MALPKFYLISFVLGVVVGLFLIFSFNQQKPIIYDYPKPFDNKIYKDSNNMCYQYITKEVKCNENEKTLKQYPIQN
jgi:hypothetical protein